MLARRAVCCAVDGGSGQGQTADADGSGLECKWELAAVGGSVVG